MPIPWLTLIKAVPWGDVISNAPKVAEGAKKLWNAVDKRREAIEPKEARAVADLPPELRSMQELESRLAASETAVADLHTQMAASAELIKALAEQNAQLIRRAETSRIRVLWLAVVCGLIGIVAVTSLLLSLGGATG